MPHTNRLFRFLAADALALAALALAAGCAGDGVGRSAGMVGPIDYPPAERVAHVDDYHGTEVADPYRWLEDPDAPESRAWIEAQNDITFDYLRSVPSWDDVNERLTHLWNYERFGIPFKEGGRYFYSRNDGLQNHSVLYVAPSLDAEPRVLIDPNTFSEDGTVSLAGYAVSEDGRHIAYGTSDGGSDWRTWRVREIATGDDTGDVIEWVKFSGVSWDKRGEGFFYSRYDAPEEGQTLQGANRFHKLYYHRLGTPQARDVLVYERPDQEEWGFGGEVTEDGEYLVITVWRGTHRENGVFYKPLTSPSAEVVELLNAFDASYNFVGNRGTEFWFVTDLDAPKSRLVAMDVANPGAGFTELIPESDETLQGASAVGGRFMASYLKDAYTRIRAHDLDGRHLHDVELPGIGSAGGFGGELDDPETFFTFTSFTTPPTIFRYDVASGERSVFRAPDVDFDPDRYTTRQVFYRSADGTRIPMFLTFRNDLKRTGNNPTLLYGYGGFNIPLTPSFSVANIVWLEMGGVYAVANIRGGGEYGEEWHRAGTKLDKQNVFDDFIGAAEALVANGWTSPDRLAIFGGSNGGLLVGACITQRPELFGAAIPAVGVLDMLRFHTWTIGWAWASDYGSSDDPAQFEALFAYSPYHNTRPGTCYPPTLITTADHDDRVVPAHSFKFAAALQHAQSCDNPVLIRIETRAGHGAGKPTSMQIEEVTDRYAFLIRALNMDVPKGFGG